MNNLGEYLKPYLIADIGCNHEGDFSLAKELVWLAANGGADAVKFQTFDKDNLFNPNSDEYKNFSNYRDFTPDQYQELADHCYSHAVDFMSTPFDLPAVDILDPLVRVFKIASPDINNYPLLAKVAATGKPLILSTGTANYIEINDALHFIKSVKNVPIILLHCISKYPTDINDAQLAVIQGLKKLFGNRAEIGYSDHMVVDGFLYNLYTAALLGATVIEKHFTFSQHRKGYDHAHSMTKHNLQYFKVKMRKCHTMYGSDVKDVQKEEKERKAFRRSIVARRDIQKGTVISLDDIVCVRPAGGIPPNLFYDVVGKKTKVNVSANTPLEWSQLYY